MKKLYLVKKSKSNPTPKSKKKSPWIEILESVVIAVVLALLIRTFLFQPYHIPSESMTPNLMVGDRIIVSKLNYIFGEPKRGEIMVFKNPDDPSVVFVKRTIGLEGDNLSLLGGQLYINGNLQGEDYLIQGLMFSDFGPAKVPEGEYFMLGDNRNNSDDSRIWGPLPEENIIGKAVFI